MAPAMLVAVPPDGVSVHVHHRGEGSVDGILRLIDIAAGDRPIEPKLSAMCAEIAAIAAADVVSVYVREARPGGDVLVMRGNTGFDGGAVGSVTLRIGEGLTGMVGECMRPVSVAVAARDSHYKHVPGLGEERYPAFVGVPILAPSRAVGVLVLQRRQTQAFSSSEIALVTALSAPVALAIDRASRNDDERLSARLVGTGVSLGSATARAVVVPRLSAVPDAGEPLDLALGLARLRGDLDRVRHQLPDPGDNDVRRALDNLGLVLADPGFHRRLEEGNVHPLARLRAAARDYARVPYRVAARHDAMEPALAERGREMEDLCVLLWASASPKEALPPARVWLTDRLGAFVALCAAARGAAAVAAEGAVASASAAIVRAAHLPAMAEVEGLFAWARRGDLVQVDAETGTLSVNPTGGE